jgi:hypothetical protein
MRFLTYLFTILLLTTSVAALNITVVTHDTDVQSTYNYLKACSCGSTVDAVRIKNIGQLEATYVFELQTTKPWFTLDRAGLYLMPGESRDIYIFTTVPCGEVGSASYTLYTASEYGRYRAVEKTVETGVCENIKADIQPIAATVQPCGTQEFALNLTNVATFRETYVIEGLDFTPVTLEAGESRIISGTYSASCTEYGQKTIPITVRSELNGMRTEKQITVTVPRAYDYQVSTDIGAVTKPVCVGVPTTVPVTVKNIEDRDNTYTVSESTSGSVDIPVEAKKTATGYLTFTPERAGDYEFTVQATGQNGAIEKTARMNIPVEACYGYTIEAADTISACPGNLTVPFTITSTGTQRQTITLDIMSNGTTRIDSESVTLNPGQELAREVQVDVLDADRAYYVTLNATTPFWSQQETTTVRGYSTESCYAVNPTAHKFRVWTDQEVLPVVITHTGLQPATYNISYNGTFMQPQESSVMLTPGEQRIIHFNVNVSEHETGRYVHRLTMESHGVYYTTDFEVELREKGFWEQFKDAVRWNGDFAFCSIISILALLVLIAVLIYAIGVWTGGINTHPERTPKQMLTIIGSALLILFLVGMIMSVPHLNRTYERPIQPANESALFYEIGQGQELTLDVASLFADPDRDTLTFTTNQPEHLQVRVEGTTAIVKADTHYAGMETLVFTASDARNGTADSDIITVSIVPFKPVTFIQYWIASCWFFTFLCLFLATLIGLLLLLTMKEKKQTSSVVYKRQRTELVRGEATELVERADEPVAAPVQPSMTQVNAEKIIINQGTGEQLWVASADGIKFHRITCPIIKNTPKEKRVTFATREDAVKAGYTPCKTCSSHE